MASQSASEEEHQPLLRHPSGKSHTEEDEPTKAHTKAWPSTSFLPSFTVLSPRYRYVPLLGCLIVLINESEYLFKQAATFRAIESMHCHEYYIHQNPNPALVDLGKHIPERLCKMDWVQKRVASTAGTVMVCRMVCALIGAVPLGALADRKGRKVVVVLHKLNVLMSACWWLAVYLLYPRVPIWALYFAGLPGLVGGNFDLGLAVLFASYTDVMPNAGERATLFFLTTSMQYVAQVVCPGIGGWLMNLDGKGGTPQVSFIVSIGAAAVCAAIAIFGWPETIQENGGKQEAKGNQERANEDSPEPSEPEANRIRRWLNAVTASLHGIGVLPILFLSIAMLSASVGIKSTDWYSLLQYPVIKLHWTYPQASVVLSIQAVVLLANYWGLLPLYNRLGQRYLGSAANASFAVMLGSSIILAVGAVMTGLSTTSALFILGMVVYTSGEGLTVSINAFIASTISKQYLARVMSVVSLAATGGKAIASALFPQVLAIGLDTHVKELVGLPLLCSAGLFIVAGVSVVVARLSMPRTKEPEEVLEG